jgi:hypothetical protein
VKILARCKHCTAQRTWEALPDGAYAGVGGKAYGCLASPTGECEPHVEGAGARMVRELAEGMSKRFRTGGRSAKRGRPRS